LKQTQEEILKILALKKRAHQSELEKKTSGSYRTVGRNIDSLEEWGLIEYIEKVNERPKRGKTPKYWKITSLGLSVAFSIVGKDLDKLNEIVETHKNEFQIFKEWDYICRNERVKNFVVEGVLKWANDMKRFIRLETLGIPEDLNIFWKTTQNGFGVKVEGVGNGSAQVLPSESALNVMALGVYELFSGNVLLEKKLDDEVEKVIDYLLENPNLRKIIRKSIETTYKVKTYTIELDEEILGFVSSWKSRRGL